MAIIVVAICKRRDGSTRREGERVDSRIEADTDVASRSERIASGVASSEAGVRNGRRSCILGRVVRHLSSAQWTEAAAYNSNTQWQYPMATTCRPCRFLPRAPLHRRPPPPAHDLLPRLRKMSGPLTPLTAPQFAGQRVCLILAVDTSITGYHLGGRYTASQQSRSSAG